MTSFRSEFLHTLSTRGFLHQGTDLEGLDDLLSRECVTGYIGFDATAASLHVGNLLQIMLLLHFQRTGHRPLALLGGGTTKIGDPSGKDSSRQLLSEERIEENISSVQKAFSRFLTFGNGSADALMVNNALWLDKLNYLEFLRDYGRHFSVNRMLSMDSVKMRLEREQPLSFLEFNYPVLQAYDFVELSKTYGCRLQMGGSDQWGNIVNGVDLARRLELPPLFGVTAPLITTASGVKMGKSESGAVWINPEQLSPYQYWQFWRNTEDQDVARFLALFTLMPLEDIKRMESLAGAELNEAKILLADEATRLAHGEDVLLTIHQTTAQLFGGGTREGKEAFMETLESIVLSRVEIKEGVPILTLLVRAGLVESNGEARRLIRGKGVRWRDTLITDEKSILTLDHFQENGDRLYAGVLSAGKKKHTMVRVEEG